MLVFKEVLLRVFIASFFIISGTIVNKANDYYLLLPLYMIGCTMMDVWYNYRHKHNI